MGLYSEQVRTNPFLLLLFSAKNQLLLHSLSYIPSSTTQTLYAVSMQHADSKDTTRTIGTITGAAGIVFHSNNQVRAVCCPQLFALNCLP